MGFEQDTLIYVEQEDKSQASAAARGFAQKNIQNRAYINTLGARLAMKYLASEDINISNIYNIHSIKKILEEIDISDVMLPNIHIDVRVVFDENVIFIPKSHFEYNLVPDIYLVFHLAKDISHVKFLGFFEPKLINKNNANNEYYFIEKEKLSPAVDLKKYVENFNGSHQENVSEDDLLNSERIIIAMSDNDITENDKKYLIQQLTKSAELRDKFIEYENFETLSYQAMTDPMIERKTSAAQQDSLSLEDISDLETIESPADEAVEQTEDFTQGFAEITQEEPLEEIDTVEENEQTETTINDELTISDNFDDFGLEPIEDFSDISLDEDNTEIKEVNNDNSGFLDTAAELGQAAALGAGAAALGAGVAAAAEGIAAAETAINAAETGAEALNTGLEIIDKGIEIANDLISTDTSAPEPLSLDDIDTSMLDNIDYHEEEIHEETISLKDVEVPLETEPTDFIDKIDNKISLDDIKLEPLNEEPENINIEQETISLKDVDTTGMEVADEEFSEETISLDNVNTEAVNIVPETDFEENIMSFDNVDEPVATENDDFMDDVMSFDDVVEPEELNDNAFEAPEDNSISFDEDENTSSELLNNEINEEELNTDEIESVTSEPLDNMEPAVDEIIDNNELPQENSENESFGKNLLNNLSPENLDNISIDDLGLSDDLPSDISDDISSHELLSQIDDLLNSDIAQPPFETSAETTNNVQEEPANILDEELPSIEESLLDTEIIPDEVPVNQHSAADSLLESDSDDEMPDTAIDELLDFGDEEEQNDEDKLGVLFNDTDAGNDTELPSSMEELNEYEDSELPKEPVVPGAALYTKPQLNKKVIIVAAALVTVIAAASAVMLLKPKGDSSADIEPLSKSAEAGVVDGLPGTSPTNIESTIATNVPELEKIPVQEAPKAKTVQAAQPAKELKSAAPVRQKPASSESYLSVNRLVWDVPDALSYSPKMQNYLRTAGKSIKLSLSADLLLATEYAYTNQVKVNIKLSKDGTVQEAKVASGSGSDQIDKIVLQSVKDTLNVVKPPSSEIKTPDFNLSLIIYF
ncbi:MAG: hypothetical protein BHW55_02155 [Candidatus Melainabacteria bacterium 35_41]|nr:MAG: hypothetical protein BHW55_02155 [Candidatus Melainabacteria bacterium 35_41]